MSKREQRVEKYGNGPWVDEPDRVEFEHEGFPCLVLRNDACGFLCGYVAIPDGHPWRVKDAASAADVHGGVTFDGGTLRDQGDRFWVGFDCAHAWDISPFNALRFGAERDQSYKDVEFVKRNCMGLAEQAKAASK
jgi:hypothetical protein